MLTRNTNGRGWIYLPMETKVREMQGKLLLACFAAESGFNVVTGDRYKVESSLSCMPKGIYFAKAANQGDLDLFNKVLTMGHIIVAQDEEGLGIYRSGDKLRINRVLSDDAFQVLEQFYSWGNVDSEIIRSEVPSAQDKIVITGSPRIDLLRFEFSPVFDDEVKSIFNKYGHFILINTNFSGINHFKGLKFTNDSLKCYVQKYGAKLEISPIELLEFEKEIFHYFIDMIRELSITVPNYTFVIRPHPGENHQFWKDNMTDLSNVKVIHEGNVVPWIIAADALIHNQCTTGIESFVINKTPTIAYCPTVLDNFDMYLPNDLSYKVSNMIELKETLQSLLEAKKSNALVDDPVKRAIGHEHIASLEGEFACERIVHELKGIRVPTNKNDVNLRKTYKLYAKKFYDSVINKILKTWKSDRYSEQKFPGLELPEVMECIHKFHEVSGRFGSINVKQLDKDLYEIRCED